MIGLLAVFAYIAANVAFAGVLYVFGCLPNTDPRFVLPRYRKRAALKCSTGTEGH
jgi:hypothetical protein